MLVAGDASAAADRAAGTSRAPAPAIAASPSARVAGRRQAHTTAWPTASAPTTQTSAAASSGGPKPTCRSASSKRVATNAAAWPGPPPSGTNSGAQTVRIAELSPGAARSRYAAPSTSAVIAPSPTVHARRRRSRVSSALAARASSTAMDTSTAAWLTSSAGTQIRHSTARRPGLQRASSRAASASSSRVTNTSALYCLRLWLASELGASAAASAATTAWGRPSARPSSHAAATAATPNASGRTRSRSGGPMCGTRRSSHVQPSGVEEVNIRIWPSGARTESATQPSSSHRSCENRYPGRLETTASPHRLSSASPSSSRAAAGRACRATPPSSAVPAAWIASTPRRRGEVEGGADRQGEGAIASGPRRPAVRGRATGLHQPYLVAKQGREQSGLLRPCRRVGERGLLSDRLGGVAGLDDPQAVRAQTVGGLRGRALDAAAVEHGQPQVGQREALAVGQADRRELRGVGGDRLHQDRRLGPGRDVAGPLGAAGVYPHVHRVPVQLADAPGQRDRRAGPQGVVGLHVVGHDVGDLHQLGQVDQVAGGGDLLHHRPEELLLPADAAEVRVDVPGPHERQRLDAIHVVAAGVHVQVGEAVVEPVPGLVAEAHPADRVDHLEEAGEVDLGIMVDRHAEVLLDGLDQQRRAAEGVGGVDLVGAVAGDVDL